MYEVLDLIIFYACWGTIFVLCYYIAHYQFKYCVPCAIICFKFAYALSLLLLIRLYYLLRIEGFEMNWAQMREDFVALLNASTSAFEL